MTTQNHYYTYCFITKQDGSYAGWNSEIAPSKQEAIEKALQRSHEEDDYKVDVNSFIISLSSDENLFLITSKFSFTNSIISFNTFITFIFAFLLCLNIRNGF